MVGSSLYATPVTVLTLERTAWRTWGDISSQNGSGVARLARRYLDVTLVEGFDKIAAVEVVVRVQVLTPLARPLDVLALAPEVVVVVRQAQNEIYSVLLRLRYDEIQALGRIEKR